MLEQDPFGYAEMLAGMTLAVVLCRVGGYWLIGRFPIGVRLRRVLDSLPGAVIAATVAPALLAGGASGALAVLAAALTMVTVRNDFAAVAVGGVVAAGARAAGL